MWRALPILTCIIYAALIAMLVAIPVGCFDPDAGWWIIVRAFWTIVACAVLMLPVSIPFCFRR